MSLHEGYVYVHNMIYVVLYIRLCVQCRLVCAYRHSVYRSIYSTSHCSSNMQFILYAAIVRPLVLLLWLQFCDIYVYTLFAGLDVYIHGPDASM